MKSRLLFLAIILVSPFIGMKAQNLHFTYYDMAPMYVNPALTGDFLGTARVTGIIREQGRAITKPFQTLNLALDANIIRGFTTGDWISAGVVLNAFDNSGTLRNKRSGQDLSLAYHLAMGKKAKNILSIGVQYARASRSLDLSEARTTSFYVDGNTADVDQLLMSTNNEERLLESSYSDIVAGLVLKTQTGKSSYTRVGLSVGNILSPDISLVNSSRDELDLRIMSFFDYRGMINKRLAWRPSIFYQRQGPFDELQLHAVFDYLAKPEKGIVVSAGLGSRLANSLDLQWILGGEYKDFKLGISYDMNLTGLSGASNTVGGYEFALGYIYKLYKKPKVKPIIICPRL